MTRHRRRRWRLPRVGRREGAAAILLLALALVAHALLRPAESDPRRALPEAKEALAAHRWSAARDAALRAVEADPRSGAAQLVLARASVELGDGVAAEAAAGRAAATGVSAATLHGLRAAARLLQGDGDGALAEAARGDDGLSARVTARALAAAGEGGRARQALLAWLGRAPRDAAVWAELGRTRLDGGDVGGAAEAAARAVALGGRDPATLVLAGEVARTRVGLKAALPWFDAAVRRDPGYHPALIEQAATLGEMGRYREMLAASRRALAARPGSAQALYLQAVLAARSGRPALARALLARADGGLDGLPGAQLLAGAVAMQEGNAEAAVSAWRDLSAAQPDNPAVRRLLGAALLRSGDAGGALAALKPLATRADADAYALEVAARAMARTGDRATAAILHDRALAGRGGAAAPFGSEVGLGTLQAAAAESPDDPARVLALVRGQIANGQGAAALATARELAAAGPGVPAAQALAGDVLLLGGDARGAAAAFARAANLRFDEPAMLRLVDAYGRTGQPAAAAGVLAAYLSQNADSVAALRLAGHWQMAARQWPAAIRSLERARWRGGSKDAAVLADLALAYAGAGRTRDAREAGAAAYALAPGQVAVVTAYGAVLAAAGDREGARQMREKAGRLVG